VRRGILTGTLAGFVAGWLAFAGYARAWAQSALSGVNAGVVGLLVAALIGLASTAIASLR
jgi:hypothetical protein